MIILGGTIRNMWFLWESNPGLYYYRKLLFQQVLSETREFGFIFGSKQHVKFV